MHFGMKWHVSLNLNMCGKYIWCNFLYDKVTAIGNGCA